MLFILGKCNRAVLHVSCTQVICSCRCSAFQPFDTSEFNVDPNLCFSFVLASLYLVCLVTLPIRNFACTLLNWTGRDCFLQWCSSSVSDCDGLNDGSIDWMVDWDMIDYWGIDWLARWLPGCLCDQRRKTKSKKSRVSAFWNKMKTRQRLKGMLIFLIDMAMEIGKHSLKQNNTNKTFFKQKRTNNTLTDDGRMKFDVLSFQIMETFSRRMQTPSLPTLSPLRKMHAPPSPLQAVCILLNDVF